MIERCKECGFFSCETLKVNGEIIRTIHLGGDIFKRNFEIEDCELRKETPCVSTLEVQGDTIKIIPQ